MGISNFNAEKIVIENSDDNLSTNILKAKENITANDTEIRFKQQMQTWPQIDIEAMSVQGIEEYLEYIPNECIAEIHKRINALKSDEEHSSEKDIQRFNQIIEQYESDLNILKAELERRSKLAR